MQQKFTKENQNFNSLCLRHEVKFVFVNISAEQKTRKQSLKFVFQQIISHVNFNSTTMDFKKKRSN